MGDGGPIQDDELRPVVSLFADVVGSTGLGEQLAPAEIKTLVGECVSQMCGAVEAFGGSVRSYMGDGIAGFFGIDATREDDCERAVRAALEIRKLLSGYSREVADAWGIRDFNVRIGINAGGAAVGVVGAGEPQRVALGDSVNVAARLQSAAPPGSVVIGKSVRAAILGRYAVRPMGELAVKGRSSPVDAYELVGVDDRSEHFEARSPFVARAIELGRLQACVEDVMQGRGQVLFVSGDTGIGKSRLIEEARRRVGSDVVWLSGTCDPIDERRPFEPFVQVLRSWLGVTARSPEIEVRIRLVSRGKELLGARFDEMVGHLARLLDISLGAKADGTLDGLPTEARALGLAHAYRCWLVAMARRRAVVVAIDNFSAASSSTADLALEVLKATDEAPILFILPVRGSAGAAQLARATVLSKFAHRYAELELDSLSTCDAEALVRALDEREALDGRLVELIVERAEGNPLFVEQLYAALTEARLGTSERLRVPDALNGVLLARVSGLSEGAQRTLTAGAILGRVFAREVVSSMVGDTEAASAITELLRAGIIRERGIEPRGYEFRHGLLRDATLSLLTPARVRTLHALAATALEGWTEYDEERDFESLAEHFTASGRESDAAACLERAGDRFARVYRASEAIELYERCLVARQSAAESGPAARVALKVAELLSSAGEFDRALEILGTALGELTDNGTRREVLLFRARCLEDCGMADAAEEDLTALAELPGGAPPGAILLRGQIALCNGDLEACRGALQQVGELQGLDVALQFEAASLATGLFLFEGDLDDAEHWSLRAQHYANQLGQVRLQLTARRHMAIVCLYKGCTSESYQILQGVYRDCSRLMWTTRVGEAALDFMHVAHLLGELKEAARIGFEVLEQTDDAPWADGVAANLAVVCGELGRFREARALATRALRSRYQLPPMSRASLQGLAELVVDDALVVDAIADHCARVVEEDKGSLTDLDVAILEANRAEYELVTGRGQFVDEFLVRVAQHPASRDPLARIHFARIRLWAEGRVGKRASAVEQLRGLLREARLRQFRLEEGRLLMTLADLAPECCDVYIQDAERIFRETNAALALRELDEVRTRLISAPV
jgi:class 3 adenylate cyclase/tetratricopeptide (TPR) repeat protein